MGRGKIERRGSNPRRTKPVILIVTEGEKSEPKYFEHFRTRQNNVEVRVIPNSKKGSKTDYFNLIRKASKICRDDDLSPKSGDSVWIVADGDIDYQVPDAVRKKNEALAQARAMAERESYALLISNPCFELWYLLHLRYTTAHLAGYDVVKKALERAGIVDYEKHHDLYEQLCNMTSEAINRAKRLEKHQVENGFSLPLSVEANPFTEVYKLVERLAATANND